MTPLPISESDRTSAYTGRATNWPTVIVTSLLVVPLLLGSKAEAGWAILAPAGIVAVGIILNILTASSVRATAGPNGVSVNWGLVGWPHLHYSLSEIQQAEVIDLPWYLVSFGLWWMPRTTYSTVRSGPTLRLVTTNGRTITITVPDPAAAVDALTAARAAQRG